MPAPPSLLARLTAVQAFTVIVTVAWIASLVIRVRVPELANNFTTVDTGMLLVLGYYFAHRSLRPPGSRP